MVNIFLIIYWFLIVGYLLIAAAVIYHLWVFHLNKKTAVFMTIFFTAGALILLFINFNIASKISWDEFILII